MIVFVVASASLADAVRPTVVPMLAFSTTEFTEGTESVTAPVSNSSRSFRLIVKTVSAVEPSTLVARTVMLWLDAASRSSSVPSATVTTPVVLLMVNRPPASSNSE